MMVSFDYSEKLKAAYKRGAYDALAHLKMNGPKPDAEKYLKELAKRPTVARL